MTDVAQLPNILAANEHLHRRLQTIAAENETLRLRVRELEAANAALITQLNGDAA